MEPCYEFEWRCELCTRKRNLETDPKNLWDKDLRVCRACFSQLNIARAAHLIILGWCK